uniref:Ig-like domain-containing protein n=1 Tax=Ciona savignyi TaxID=51511 RepID=H2YNK4_CIOSA
KLVEGSSIKLECVISGSPAPKVTWAKNGQMLQSGHRFKIIADRKKHLYCLGIGMVFPEDVGEYTISATNQFGFISGSVMLMSEARSPGGLRMTSASPVKRLRETSMSPIRTASPSKRLEEIEQLDIEKYFRPRFLKKPDSRECNEGETTRIDCKVTGRPLPDVIFYRNDAQVYEDYNHRIVVKEDGVRSLIISPAKPEDSGEYTVVARSAAGKAVSTLSLTVIPQEGAERPRILEKPQSVTVNEGDMVRLEVFAVGRPTPEIVWLKDNVLLIPEKHPELRIEGVDGHGLLTINRAAKGLHDAWYTATAVNKVGRDLSRCKVNVSRTESEPEPSRKLYIPKAKGVKPVVEPSPERVDLRKLDNFDETDLYDSSRMQKPRIKKKVVSAKQKILGAVHFECHIVPIGDPNMKVEWLLDGKELEYANRIMTTFEFGYAALDISAVYPRDTGVISCRATNQHGQVQTSCTLIVKEERGLVERTQLPDTNKLDKIQTTERHRQEISLAHVSHQTDDEEVPSAPKIVLNPDPVRVQEGDPARFRCRVVGFPLPKVDWYLNGQAIRQSKRFRIWSDGIHYFEIATVRGYDHGEVKMVAQNIEGRIEASTTIEVTQAKDLRSVLHRADIETSDVTTKKEKGRHMVPLREVEKPIAGLKKVKRVERHEELQSKFSKLSEEERMVNTLQADMKKTSQRDRKYESFIRQTKDQLSHWEEAKPEEKQKNPFLERPKQYLPAPYEIKVDVTPDMQAPVVLERLHNSTVQAGSVAKFRVRFHGNPEPELAWYRNEVVLEKSDRVGWIFPEDNVCELFIRDAQVGDSGSISVRISNPAGQAGSQGFLLVQETVDALHFTESLADVEAKENDKSVIFECSVSDYTAVVEWRRCVAPEAPEEVLRSSEKFQTRSEGALRLLRITDIHQSDAGTYSCVMLDADGKEIKSTAQLIVKGTVSKKIEVGLKNQVAREGTISVFNLSVSHADVSGTWTKDGATIQENQKYNISDVGNKRSLTVNDARSTDEGVYEYIYDADKSSSTLAVQAMHVSIVKKLKDLSVFAGEVVTFEVKISRDDAIASWTRNDQAVTSDGRVITTSDRSRHMLIIENCTATDSGTYTFAAGTASCSATLEVKDVTVTSPIQNTSSIESMDAQFECNVDKPGYTAGKWFHGESELTSDDSKYTVKTEGATQRLIIRNTSSDDSGVYHYVTGSQSVTKATLDVATVEITEQLHDITEAETAPVTLTANLSESGAHGVWYKNGQRLQDTSNCSAVVDGKQHSLFIRSLTLNDQGQYEFRVGNKTTSASLTVQGAEITKPLVGISATETETARFECQVASDSVQGSWMKNGQLLDADYMHRFVSSSEGRTQILTINDVTKEDAGNYSFKFGSASTAAELSVTGIKFAKGLRNITVAEGSDASFTVEVATENISKVRWDRNGVMINCDDVKYSIHSKGNLFTLVVHCVSKKDEAAYSCIAGSAKTSARLYVEAVNITRKLTEVRAMEHRNVEMTTEVTNSSVSGIWSRDGVTITQSERIQTTHRGKTHQLVITDAQVEDTGSYQFAVGKSTTSAKVVVEAIHLTSRMKDVMVKESQTATFECEVSHPDVPAAACKWTKNGIVIKPNNMISITVDGCVHRLKINTCSAEDSGEYMFTAGEDTSTAALKVEAVTIVKHLPKKLQATAHEVAVLECAVDAPGITAYWTKDGKRIDATEKSLKYEASSRDVTHTLKVKDLVSEDAGVYEFVAGSVLSKTTLFVEVVAVEITKSVKNIEVVENKKA